jgi:hypothetical protein
VSQWVRVGRLMYRVLHIWRDISQNLCVDALMLPTPTDCLTFNLQNAETVCGHCQWKPTGV